MMARFSTIAKAERQRAIPAAGVLFFDAITLSVKAVLFMHKFLDGNTGSHVLIEH